MCMEGEFLKWQYVHKGYYVANPDGSAERWWGEPIYVVRQVASGDWIAFSPDGYFLGRGGMLYCRKLSEGDVVPYRTKVGWPELM